MFLVLIMAFTFARFNEELCSHPKKAQIKFII